MSSRSQIIKEILPQIEIDNSNSSEIELFQSKTLRPILKFQNELILLSFQTFLKENKVNLEKLSPNLVQEKITDLIKSNLQIKQFYLGMVVALFNLDEFIFYSSNKKEINKRIFNLITTRIVSQN